MNKQYDLALSDFNQTITIAPKPPDAYYFRGFTYAKKNQHAEAIKDYDRTIKIKPSYYRAYFSKGWSHEKLGQLNEALDAYNNYLKYAPANEANKPKAQEKVATLKEEIAEEKEKLTQKAIPKRPTARKPVKKAEAKEAEGDLYTAPVAEEAF